VTFKNFLGVPIRKLDAYRCRAEVDFREDVGYPLGNQLMKVEKSMVKKQHGEKYRDFTSN
jgi:hypothetical protein